MDHAVDRHFFPRTDAQMIARNNGVDVDFFVRPVIIDADGRFRREAQQGFQRPPGLFPRAQLQHLPQQDKDGNDGRCLKIDRDFTTGQLEFWREEMRRKGPDGFWAYTRWYIKWSRECSVRLTITYPASTGRNFDEILRVIDSLQLTSDHKLATPANWTHGEDCIVVPAVSTEDAKKMFDGVTEVKPYLRYAKAPTGTPAGS